MITIKLSNYSTRKEYVHQLLNNSFERSIGRKIAFISSATHIPFLVVASYAKELFSDEDSLQEIDTLIKRQMKFTGIEAIED